MRGACYCFLIGRNFGVFAEKSSMSPSAENVDEVPNPRKQRVQLFLQPTTKTDDVLGY